MKLSIITVTYNSADFLQDCITSINSQNYKDKEYIIIDGGSKDGTVELIKKNSEKIDKWISEPDHGIYDAMNKGVVLAKGDVIGLLNSDDFYIDDNVLSDVMRIFESDPSVDIVYSDLIYVDRNNTDKIIRTWISGNYYKGYFQNGNVPAHPTLFIRNKVYKKAGLFNLKFRIAADYEFILRIFEKYHFKSSYLNRITVKMRLGGESSKNLKNKLLQNKEVIKSWKLNNLSFPCRLIPLRVLKKLQQYI